MKNRAVWPTFAQRGNEGTRLYGMSVAPQHDKALCHSVHHDT